MSRPSPLPEIVRRASARTVPGRRDRFAALERTEAVVLDAVDLHVQGGSDGDVDRYLAAAAPRGVTPSGLLSLTGVRCETGADPLGTGADPVVGALRGRRGRPLRGPGALLDLARPRGPRRGRRVLEVDGALGVLDLRARAATNYFHLLVDAVASRWLIERLAGSATPDRWLLPVGPTPWQAEVLELAGLRDVVLPLSAADRIVARRVLVPVRGLGSRHVPDWAVTALRAVAGPPPEPVGVPSLLHVARGDARRRRVRGEAALAEGLARLGFDTVAADRIGVADQRRRFAGADVVVAAHGAALTNLAWARPGATVVELLPAGRPNLAFRRLARQAGVRHVGLICPATGTGDDPHGDLEVDVPAALRLVEGVLAGTV